MSAADAALPRSQIPFEEIPFSASGFRSFQGFLLYRYPPSSGMALAWKNSWVDIDPDPTRFEPSRAEILAAMQAEQPPFSCIVDSGNGYQGYKFIEPYRIDGDPQKLKEFESRNLAISKSLTARLKAAGTAVAVNDNDPGVKIDKCHSADHLMRLPGTINFLTAKKRVKGYPEGDRPGAIRDFR